MGFNEIVQQGPIRKWVEFLDENKTLWILVQNYFLKKKTKKIWHSFSSLLRIVPNSK